MAPLRFPKTRGFALINEAALCRNYHTLLCHARKSARGAEVIAVVKANAYGHGLGAVLPPLLRCGCRRLALATLDEAIEARALAPNAQILVLGYTPPERAAELAAHGIEQTVFSRDYARALSRAAKRAAVTLSVQIKIDGGMSRLGFSPDDKKGLLFACNAKGLCPVGIFTHFPTADADPDATKAALTRFLACRRTLGAPLFAHAAASAACLTLPEATLDAVRVGLALYGISPTKTPLPLSPVLSLYAPIVSVREVEAGTPIGYGGRTVTKRRTRIGVLPIGYADGVPRALCALPPTLTRKNRRFSLPVLGLICMDQMMIDLTGTPAKLGDTVCLWQSAEVAATALGITPYEVLTALSPRVARIVQ